MFVYDKLPLSPRSLCCAFRRSDTAVQRHSYAARAHLSFLYHPESRPCNRAGNKPRQSNYHESNVEQCYMILYLHVLELACD
jgi:hypothetical protein